MPRCSNWLNRPKLNRYINLKERQRFLRELSRIVEFVSIIQFVRECRDRKDDKFLDVALNGKADLMIMGDEDLLAMDPWRGIQILSPVEFLNSV